MRKLALLGLCLILFAGSAQAQSDFEAEFFRLIGDGVLDRRDYARLGQLEQGALDVQDRQLADFLLSRLRQRQQRTEIRFNYVKASGSQEVTFDFEPNYAEDDTLSGSAPEQILAALSQGDLLPATLADDSRCSAAALLAGHLIVYGSFDRALQTLGLPQKPVTYRKMHLAQEILYRAVNADQVPGLSMAWQYTLNPADEPVDVAIAGETPDAAQRIGLVISLLPASLSKDPEKRKQAIRSLWQERPQVPLLLSVHSDSQARRLSGADARRGINHVVLIFRHGGKIWLYDSGKHPGSGVVSWLSESLFAELVLDSHAPLFLLESVE